VNSEGTPVYEYELSEDCSQPVRDPETGEEIDELKGRRLLLVHCESDMIIRITTLSNPPESEKTGDIPKPPNLNLGEVPAC
jgi:hypothetical protein